MLKDTIVQLAREGTTIIFSTHQMEVAERICDHVCIIARGKKVLDGGVAEVKRLHGGRHVAVSFEDLAQGAAAMRSVSDLIAIADDSGGAAEIKLVEGTDPQTLLARLMSQNVRLKRFEQVEPSLHRIFLDLAGPEAAEPERREVANA